MSGPGLSKYVGANSITVEFGERLRLGQAISRLFFVLIHQKSGSPWRAGLGHLGKGLEVDVEEQARPVGASGTEVETGKFWLLCNRSCRVIWRVYSCRRYALNQTRYPDQKPNSPSRAAAVWYACTDRLAVGQKSACTWIRWHSFPNNSDASVTATSPCTQHMSRTWPQVRIRLSCGQDGSKRPEVAASECMCSISVADRRAYILA